MRTLTFTSAMLFGLCYAGHTQQLSVLPQVGMEVSRATMKYNNMNCFSPLGSQVSPELGLRMDYLFKKNHGPMFAVSTSRSAVEFSFKDPETGLTSYQATPGDLRLNLEAGYSFKSKPIYFKRAAANPVAKAPAPNLRSAYGGCRGFSSRYHASTPESARINPQQQNKGWSVAIQPMLALALIRPTNPDIRTSMEAGQAVYRYTAGNWNAAMVMGAGFEFGKNDQRRFTIGLSSLSGIGNLNERNITAVSAGKSTTTTLRSGVSAWSVTAGIPITIYKKKNAGKAVNVEKKANAEKIDRPVRRCWQYRSSCIRAI